MPESSDPDGETVYRAYIKDVRIVERGGKYHFEAPMHVGASFDDPELATLYADIYFDVNGFREEGTGELGVPPELIQAGKDTIAAYLLTQLDEGWVASFLGAEPPKLHQYTKWVRDRAEEIRQRARENGVE